MKRILTFLVLATLVSSIACKKDNVEYPLVYQLASTSESSYDLFSIDEAGNAVLIETNSDSLYKFLDLDEEELSYTSYFDSLLVYEYLPETIELLNDSIANVMIYVVDNTSIFDTQFVLFPIEATYRVEGDLLYLSHPDFEFEVSYHGFVQEDQEKITFCYFTEVILNHFLFVISRDANVGCQTDPNAYSLSSNPEFKTPGTSFVVKRIEAEYVLQR